MEKFSKKKKKEKSLRWDSNWKPTAY